MASIFEKTMAACLESKRTAQKATSKRVTESVKKPAKKLRESDEIDAELGIDTVADDVMDDVVDDIVVVVDPDLDPEEVNDAAAEAQDIIDGTPEGDIPSTDEYIGDFTYTCPICGNTFFSEVEMADGDECPVCGDTPNGYVLVGEIAPNDDVVEEEEVEDDIIDDDIIDDDVEDVEDLEPALDVESLKRKPAPAQRGLMIDESTFNPFMNKFIRENYRNAKSFVITGARIKGKTLSLECALSFKTGKSKKVMLKVENFKPAKKAVFAARDDGTFKSESKKAPFMFAVAMDKNVIRCEGLKYDFVTKAVKEGKKVQIAGNLLRESAKK